MSKKKKIGFIITGVAIVSIPLQSHAFNLIKNNILSSGLNLSATSNTANNSIRLDWSGDVKDKTFKVFQKKPGNTDFQTISATNFDKNKQVKVLNIYPAGGEVESYTTWDGENISLMKSASLKRWMEEPNSENPKGYGKGVIEVTPVLLSDFNLNPNSYMKNDDGTWKYDVVMVGSYDCNGSCSIDGDLTPTSASIVRSFIQDGKGALLGHDTAYYNTVHGNLNSLVDLFNMKIGSGIHTPTAPTQVQGTSITVKKKGLLTNYPWEIGDINTKLNIPYTHTTGQLTKGDIWMDFDLPSPDYDDGYKGNFYLTTWNNTGYVLTGHSNGSATPDEQKLLANTLFYLNQLSTETYLEDNSGQDVNSPNKVEEISHSFNNGFIDFSLIRPTDKGSTYEYYVLGEGKDGSTIQSNTVSETITSGINGYSFVVDTNPNTVPDNIVDTTSDTIKANVTANNLYLHVKSIDNAGNVSDVTHYNLSDTTKPTMTITGNPTSWTNQNATLRVTATDTGSGIREIVLPDGTIVNGGSANYTVSANGNYSFIVRDNMGNQTTQVVNVTKIDKTINNIMNINQSMSIVDDRTSTRKMSFTFNPVVDNISGLKGYSFVVDKNQNTIPDNNINTISNTIEQNITDAGVYYLHIKAIDNAGNTSAINHIKVDIPKLKAKANISEDKIRLDWDMDSLNGKSFKVYQKKPGSADFQSISTTNIEKAKTVKVLNVYPNAGNHLKSWMENSNSEDVNGYGKGIIKVDPVSINDFNSNPNSYMKNDDGTWKYDVVMFGTWDANNYVDINLNARNIVEEFIQDGRGALFGHDTTCSNNKWENFSYLGVNYLNMTNAGVDTGRHTNITVTKKGLLTNYPWNIGDVGTGLTIPSTHSFGQSANGDIWMRYTNDTSNNGNNFYLTTWNNLAMIQTGHSNGLATPDEQKLLANTLFYLNQISTDNYLDDNSGQDVTAPNMPQVYEHKFINKNEFELKYHAVEDNGSEYSYYVESQTKDNDSLTLSNVVSETITSGIKGYSFVVDNNSNTIPDNEIETNKAEPIRFKVNDTTKYVHIKAIDNKGNAGETYHYQLTDTINPSMTITGNPTEWTNEDVTLNVTAEDNESGLSHIVLPNGNVVRGNTANYTVTSNGNYTFKAVDYLGNETVETVVVTKIDKTAPIINVEKEISVDKSNATLNVTVTDTISGFSYLLTPNGDKITSPNYSLNTTQNGEYLFVAYDLTGNMTVLSVTVNELNTNVIPSEIDRIEYKLSGATTKDWTVYEKAFYVTDEGITTITARAIDKAGNVSDETTSTVRIDKTKPISNGILIELR